MDCPHCKKEIDDKLVGKYFASKGGKASSRTLSSEDAKAMVRKREAIKKKKAGRN